MKGEISLRTGESVRLERACTVVSASVTPPDGCTLEEVSEYVEKVYVEFLVDGKAQFQGPVRLFPVTGYGGLQLKTPIRAAAGSKVEAVFKLGGGQLRHGAALDRLHLVVYCGADA